MVLTIYFKRKKKRNDWKADFNWNYILDDNILDEALFIFFCIFPLS